MKRHRDADCGSIPTGYWHPLAASGADIFSARPYQAVIGKLLEDMCGPARNPAAGKNRSKQIRWYAERVVGRGRIEIYIRVQVLVAHHYFFHLSRHLVPERIAYPITEQPGHIAQMGGSRVFGAVDAMTEAHYLGFPGELVFEPWLDVVYGTDFQQVLDYSFVGAAMQGPLESAD